VSNLISCPDCGKEISINAFTCPNCGRQMKAPEFHVAENKIPLWSPGVAGLLSLLIPGLGQMYKTKFLIGFIWLIIAALGYVCLVIPGIVIHILCICDAASGDRYKDPKDKSNEIK